MLFFYRATGITLWAIIKSAHPAAMAVLRFFFSSTFNDGLLKRKRKKILFVTCVCDGLFDGNGAVGIPGR